MANKLLGPLNKVPGQQFINDEEYPELNLRNFEGGLNVDLDWADIKDEEFAKIDCVYIRNGKITLQKGESIVYSLPSTYPVRQIYTALQYDGTAIQVIFSDNAGVAKIYRRGIGAWTEITATTTAVDSPVNKVISTDNQHFFSNGGADYIQQIDFATNEYDRLGNAPAYKYITAFYNRIVGAGLDGTPIQIGWSGDFNFDEWDPTVDFTAGFAPLEESQADYADFITGLEGFANQMVILRERSIWLCNKTPGLNPFFFYTAVPSIGCDVPNSVQRIPNGVIFYDKRTNNFYRFDVQQGLSPIGDAVKDMVQAGFGFTNPTDIIDLTQAQSGFDPLELEYRFFGPNGEGSTTCFVYSLRNNTWYTENRDYLMTAYLASSTNAVSVLINDLPGNIEDLNGTIDGLQPDTAAAPTVFFGTSTGDIKQYDATQTRFGSIISKLWTPPDNRDFYVHRVAIEYQPFGDGTMYISFSKTGDIDNLNPFYNKLITYSSADAGKRLVTICNRPIKTREFAIALELDGQQVSILSIKALTVPSGYTR